MELLFSILSPAQYDNKQRIGSDFPTQQTGYAHQLTGYAHENNAIQLKNRRIT